MKNLFFQVATLSLLVFSSSAFAQTDDPAPQEVAPEAEPVAEAAPPPECIPDCSPGYTCVNGECISACNPPCGPGQVCSAERICTSPPQTQHQPVQQARDSERIGQESSNERIRRYLGSEREEEFEEEEDTYLLRVTPSLYLGFLGKYSYEQSGSTFITPTDETTLMNPTFGGGVSAAFNLARFVRLGAELNIYSHQLIGADNRSRAMSTSLLVGFQYPIVLTNFTIEPMLTATIGFVAFFGGESTEIGLAASVRTGVTFWFSQVIGLAVELGVDMLRDSRFVMSRRENFEASIASNEGSIRIGPSFRF